MDDKLAFEVAVHIEPGACILQPSDAGGERLLRRGGYKLLVFVLGGAIAANHGRSRVELQPGNAFVCDVGAPVRLEVRRDSEYYLVWFKTRSANDPTIPSLEYPAFCSVRRPDRLTYLLRRYLMLRERGGSRTEMCGLLVLILRELALSEASFDRNAQGAKVAATIAARVDAYIAAHYREQIGTPDIAAELHYNPVYLERAYRQQSHLSIRDAIHLRRVREAGAQLLLHKERCVLEIAEMCGYRDANYFRRIFKRTMHMTPDRFRRTHAAAKEGGVKKRVANVSA